MPYSYPDRVPAVATHWTESEQRKCAEAAQAVLSEGGSEQDSIFACIHAAGRGQKGDNLVDDLLTDIKELSLDELRRAVEYALNPPGDGMLPRPGPYKWIRELYADRAIVVVESGGLKPGTKLYSVPFTASDTGEITFGDPVEVQVAYKPIAAKKEADAKNAKAEAPMKTEGGVKFPKSDYAYTPSDNPSSWKLRLTSTPGGSPDPAIVGAAAAALGPGFRGQKVDIPDADRAAVVARVRAAWKKANPDKDPSEMPSGLKEEDEGTDADAKVGKRVQSKMREMLKQMSDMMGQVLKWANYEDEQGQPEPDEDEAERDGKKKPAAECKASALDFGHEAQGFKVYTDKAGKLRWVAWSTNAFEDRDGEIFSTKALESEVARTDAEWPADQRGLWFWHVPGSQFGTTDWRGVVGRMLVETGTFDDNSRGQKAAAYLQAHPAEYSRMSHGYRYRRDDREDGVYDWLEIQERSVLPGSAAANPWTQFRSQEVEMALTKEKRAGLEALFGPEEAAAIIEAAEQKTKELEQKGIAFKEGGEKVEENKTQTPPATEPAALDVKALAEAFAGSPAVTELVAVQKAAADKLTAVEAALATATAQALALEARLAKVEAGHETAVKQVLADLPRRAFYQASQAAETIVDPKTPEGKKLAAAAAGGASVAENPAYPLSRGNRVR